MKPDQLAVERGLPIIHTLCVAKRGSETQLKHKRSRLRPAKTNHADKLAFNDSKIVSSRRQSPSSAARRSASEQDGGPLRKYLDKDVFQLAKWADPHIQHSTRAVRIYLAHSDGWPPAQPE